MLEYVVAVVVLVVLLLLATVMGSIVLVVIAAVLTLLVRWKGKRKRENSFPQPCDPPRTIVVHTPSLQRIPSYFRHPNSYRRSNYDSPISDYEPVSFSSPAGSSKHRSHLTPSTPLQLPELGGAFDECDSHKSGEESGREEERKREDTRIDTARAVLKHVHPVFQTFARVRTSLHVLNVLDVMEESALNAIECKLTGQDPGTLGTSSASEQESLLERLLRLEEETAYSADIDPTLYNYDTYSDSESDSNHLLYNLLLSSLSHSLHRRRPTYPNHL
jgi:hypothetical protein